MLIATTSANRHHFTLLMAAMGAPMLQACSALSEADEGYEQGWRQARVVQTGLGTERIPRLVKDCRTELPADASARFAVLSYLDGAHHGIRYVAAIPPGVAVKAEQVFQVNVNDCRSPWYRLK